MTVIISIDGMCYRDIGLAVPSDFNLISSVFIFTRVCVLLFVQLKKGFINLLGVLKRIRQAETYAIVLFGFSPSCPGNNLQKWPNLWERDKATDLMPNRPLIAGSEFAGEGTTCFFRKYKPV